MNVVKLQSFRTKAIGLAGLIAVGKVAVALWVVGPWYLPDEVIYLNVTRRIFWGGSLAHDVLAAGVQPGWPLLELPLVGTLSPGAAYIACVVMASVIGAMVLLPTYALARRWHEEGTALAVAATATVMPGLCVYGWAALSEPLYTLVLMMSAACFARAVGPGGRGRDWAACLLMAVASFGVRPFGVIVIVAALAGMVVWGHAAGRRRYVVAAVGAVAGVLAAVVVARYVATSRMALTGYASEHGDVPTILRNTFTLRGLRGLGLAAARDAAYLFVASYGVLGALACCALREAIRGWGGLAPGGRGVVVGMVTLVVGTLGLSAATRWVGEIGPIYGRYVEPLLPLIVLAGAAGWTAVARDADGRRRCVLVLLVGTVLVTFLLPAGTVSFANNPGIWYWARVGGLVAPLACCFVPVLFWGYFLRLGRYGGARPFWGMAVVAMGSTALVAGHVLRYGEDTRALQRRAMGIAGEVRGHSTGRIAVWIDPGLAEAVPGTKQLNWLLRYQLPAAKVGFAVEGQFVHHGAFLLSFPSAEPGGMVWTDGAVALYRVR